MKKDKVLIEAWVSRDLHARVKALAKSQERSVSGLLRLLLLEEIGRLSRRLTG